MLRVKPPSSAVRLLDERDRDAVLAICDRDPVTNVFVSSRVRAFGLEPGRLGAQMWGHGPGGRLQSLCYSGANLVPVAATPDAVCDVPLCTPRWRRGPKNKTPNGFRRASPVSTRTLTASRQPGSARNG